MVNIKKKQCESPDCPTSSLYGWSGGVRSHCFQHRKAGMLRNPTARCRYVRCKNKASFGALNEPCHCEQHAEDGEMNLIERECISCQLPFPLNRNDMCEYCDPKSFQSGRLAKQNALMAFLDGKGLYGSSTDKIIEGGVCGKERPDRIFDLGDRVIIVECDEHQHHGNPCECEQSRMVNIGQSFGGTPVYFVRWNPDRYKTVGDKDMEPVKRRHTKLAEFLECVVDPCRRTDMLPHEKEVLVYALYMYYDGWDGLHRERWRCIT